MPKEILVYRGWIGGKESDRAALEALGVEVGTWNREAECFDGCRVLPAALARLDRRWGKYIWGLIPRMETVYTEAERKAEEEDVPF